MYAVCIMHISNESLASFCLKKKKDKQKPEEREISRKMTIFSLRDSIRIETTKLMS